VVPVAVTEKVAVWPAVIVRLIGCVVIAGGAALVPIAMLQTVCVPQLAIMPQLFRLEVVDCSERKA
jgi:hypothetical protein